MRQVITAPGQVGEILRGRRKSRRVAQQTLAEQLGIGQPFQGDRFSLAAASKRAVDT